MGLFQQPAKGGWPMAIEGKRRPRAVVTGASSGIGAAFAERLARDGYDLVLVARRRERLEALARQFHETQHATVEVFVADLAQASELYAVERRIAEDTALELLVNSAGFGGYMPFVSLDPDGAEELIRLQVVAVTRLTRAALPGMVTRGHGAIINVSSRLAFSGALSEPHLPKRAVYAATKAYLNTFTQILHQELEGTGVNVQALCPGVVRTEFHERMGLDPGRFPPAIVMSPQDIVEASLAGLRLGEVICVPALDDPNLSAHIHENQRRLWEHSNTGTLAGRYLRQRASSGQ
jgi:short-subunit dehydrogenase